MYQRMGEVSPKKIKIMKDWSLLLDKFLRLLSEVHVILFSVVPIIFIVYKCKRFLHLTMREECFVPLDKIMIFTFQQIVIILGIISCLYFLNPVMGGTRELFAASTCLEHRSRDLELWQRCDIAIGQWRASAVTMCWKDHKSYCEIN